MQEPFLSARSAAASAMAIIEIGPAALEARISRSDTERKPEDLFQQGDEVVDRGLHRGQRGLQRLELLLPSRRQNTVERPDDGLNDELGHCRG